MDDLFSSISGITKNTVNVEMFLIKDTDKSKTENKYDVFQMEILGDVPSEFQRVITNKKDQLSDDLKHKRKTIIDFFNTNYGWNHISILDLKEVNQLESMILKMINYKEINLFIKNPIK